MLEQIKTALKTGDVIITNSLVGEQGYLLSQIESPIFFVASSEENAYKISEQLTALGKKNVLIDSFDNRFSFSKFQNKDNIYKLINGIMQVLTEKVEVIITTLEGFFCQLVKKDDFISSILTFEKGKSYDLGKISEKLIEMGYRRVDVIEQIGDFSLRGDLLDIYSPNNESSVRINFFDDEIETIIYYDNINLTKVKDLTYIKIAPNTLSPIKNSQKEIIDNSITKLFNEYQDNSILEYLKYSSLPIELMPILNLEVSNLLDYLDNPILIFQNPLNLVTRFEKYKEEISKSIDIRFDNDKLKNKLKNIEDNYYLNFEKYFKNNKKYSINCIFFDNTANFNKNAVFFDLNVKNINNYLKNIELIKTDFTENELKEKTIKLCLDNEDSLQAVKEVLFNLNLESLYTLNGVNKILLIVKFLFLNTFLLFFIS